MGQAQVGFYHAHAHLSNGIVGLETSVSLCLDRLVGLHGFGDPVQDLGHIVPRVIEVLGQDHGTQCLPGTLDGITEGDPSQATIGGGQFDDLDGKFSVGSVIGLGQTISQPLIVAIMSELVAVEPENSPVLSGGNPGPHKIQGIGAGFVPGNTKPDQIDRIMRVKDEKAFASLHRVRDDLGLLVGI